MKSFSISLLAIILIFVSINVGISYLLECQSLYIDAGTCFLKYYGIFDFLNEHFVNDKYNIIENMYNEFYDPARTDECANMTLSFEKCCSNHWTASGSYYCYPNKKTMLNSIISLTMKQRNDFVRHINYKKDELKQFKGSVIP